MKHLIAARKFFARFISGQQEGLSVVETALFLALITVVCITAIGNLGARLSAAFQCFSTSL